MDRNNGCKNQSVRSAPIDYGPLADNAGYLLRRAQLWIFQDFIRTMAPLDLRPAQYSVLLLIRQNPGLSQITLACALGIERARLVRLLDQLEERRLVERRPSASDRRSHAMHLTPQGEKLLEEAATLYSRHNAAWLQELGGADNCAELIRLLGKFGKTA